MQRIKISKDRHKIFVYKTIEMLHAHLMTNLIIINLLNIYHDGVLKIVYVHAYCS